MFLNENNILYEKQFGCRPNQSTTHRLLKITEKIKQGCDFGKYADGVFLNLQKAFDIVNHNIYIYYIYIYIYIYYLRN